MAPLLAYFTSTLAKDIYCGQAGCLIFTLRAFKMA